MWFALVNLKATAKKFAHLWQICQESYEVATQYSNENKTEKFFGLPSF